MPRLLKVVYEEFDTNETMYPKVEAGTSAYDVICPSDYMIQKMIDNKAALGVIYSGEAIYT